MKLHLSGEERALLLDVLKRELAEKRVEVRRAEVRSFRASAKHEERELRALIERIETANAA